MSKRLLLFLVVLAAAQCFAGARYTAVSRTQTEGNTKAGQGPEKHETKVRGWASGDNAKVEFLQSTDPNMPPGSYMLSTDGGKTLYLVDPNTKSYVKWDVVGSLGALSGQPGVAQLEYANPKVEKLLEEPGGTLLGFPTRHYRFRTTYKVNVNIMGRQVSSTSTIEEDIWASAKALQPALRLLANRNRVKTGNEQIDRMVKAEMDKVQGLPLKTISITRSSAQDRSETVRSEMEITTLKTVPVPASTFAMPAGYRQIEMHLPTPNTEDEDHDHDH
jgi:Domain of unknown function (DUF4412)